MPFQNHNKLRYFQFEIFDSSEITQAVFTRQGGFSPSPWDSLNMGGLVGDERELVEKNRVAAFHAVNRDPDSMYDVWQVHSAEVVIATAPRPKDMEHSKADAILTDNPAVTLFMRFADCVPILLYDPVKKVGGVAHAGWQGTVKKIASAVVQSMAAQFGSNPPDILAGIGPSIGVHHYEVGPEVVNQVEEVFGNQAQSLLPSNNGKVKFNLWAANRVLLEQTGVNQIEMANLCTACHLDDWYSHRGENGSTGRFGVLIGING
jgi:YfiH family protein